jgi:hypothetical protein
MIQLLAHAGCAYGGVYPKREHERKMIKVIKVIKMIIVFTVITLI